MDLGLDLGLDDAGDPGEPGHVDLVVEVTDVGDDRLVLHRAHVLGGDDVEAARRGDDDVGTADDVLELAALLGVKFKKDARGQFAHSNVLTVLNPGGEVVHQQVGLNQAPHETVKQLHRLLHP